MTRARAGLRAAAVAAAGVAGRLVRGLPGLGALVCTIAGVWCLFGGGWALLAAVPYLLLADYRAA